MTRTTPIALASAAAGLALAGSASAATLAQYGFEDSNDRLGAGTVIAGITASDLTVVGATPRYTGPGGNPADNTFVTNEPTPAEMQSQLSLAYGDLDTQPADDGDYVQFTLMPDAGNTITFDAGDAFTFQSAGGDGNAPTVGFFSLLVDTGGGFQSVGTTMNTSGSDQSYETFSYDLGGLPDVADSVTFRLQIADGGGGNPNNSLEIDDIRASGSVTVIPEPASALAGVVGLGLLAGRRRR